jgi:SAM-dependent methyltransferase
MYIRFLSYIQKKSFQPGFGGVFLNPFYFIRSELYRSIKNAAPFLSGKMMDFGCGRKPYENFFEVTEYIGVDIEQSGHSHINSQIDVYYDGNTIPFPENTFDSVFCSEVLEHVFNPDKVLKELLRVMKPGAKMLLTAPFCWNEHEMPYDYARYSSVGLKHLLEKNGFKVLELKKTGSFARVCVQLINLYFYELGKRGGLGGVFAAMLLIVPVNLIGIFMLPLVPRNQSLYFNNIVLASKN